MWKHFCDHVKQIKDGYSGLLENTMEEFIIKLSDSESDSEEDGE